MIEEIDIVDPTPPFLLPEPYKGSLPEFAMFKHEGGGHDQQSHGNWATGYTESERAGIERMANVGPTRDELIQSMAQFNNQEMQNNLLEQYRLRVMNDINQYRYFQEFVQDETGKDFDDVAQDIEDNLLDEYIAGNRYFLQSGIVEEINEEIIEQTNNELFEKFYDVYNVSVTTEDGLTLSTEVDFVTIDPDVSEIQITGTVRQKEQGGGYGIDSGRFTRTLKVNTDTGQIGVTHDEFFLDVDARGQGLGTKFLNQSEDWYISRGISRIKLATGYDGLYTWSKAGFDFAETPVVVPALMDNVRSAVKGNNLTPSELQTWNELFERSTLGLEINNTPSGLVYNFDGVLALNTEDFPLPVEFARAPKAKKIMMGIAVEMEKFLTPEGRNLASGPIDRDGDGMVFDGTWRERPARPNELPVAAAKWSKRDSKLQAISNAYYKYGKDDFTNENEGSDQDNPELDRAIDKILGKSDFMKRLASFSYSVVKHQAGTHDQESHGNWAGGANQTPSGAKPMRRPLRESKMPYEFKPIKRKRQVLLSNEQEKQTNAIMKKVAEAPIAINLYSNELESIVEAGRFKGLQELNQDRQQTETRGPSEAALREFENQYADGRRIYEEDILRIPKDAPQPVYGYMDSKDYKPSVDMYGDVKITLKPEVSSRATFTGGDSFNGLLIPVEVDKARRGGLNNLDLVLATNNSPARTIGPYARSHGLDDIALGLSESSLPLYFEAQIHGGVRLQDIKSVSLPKFSANLPVKKTTIKKLRDLGIEVIEDAK